MKDKQWSDEPGESTSRRAIGHAARGQLALDKLDFRVPEPPRETKAMRRLELAMLSCLLSGCLAAPAADKSDDTAKWQGTWKLASCSWNGEPQMGDVQWIVDGDHYNIRLDGQLRADPCTLKLDASQNQIDVFHHDTPSGTFGGKLKGIYEIKGDSFKVCYDLTGQQYPESFDAGPGSRRVLYQFQRERR